MKRRFLFFAILAVVLAGLVFTFFFSGSKNGTPDFGNFHDIKKEEPSKETTLFFVGDIMLDRGVESSVARNFNGDYRTLFDNVGSLHNADILFGNLEGDISDKGANVGSEFSFRMDPKVADTLSEAGFDIVSFANNHVGDWGVPVFADTLERLASAGIEKTGAGKNKKEAEAPVIIKKNGVRFGFLGFSDVGPNWIEAKDNAPGILLASDPRLPEIIQNAKTDCDVLIVSFHWGIEYEKTHNARQEALAHSAIDNGADMIIGHHPHVMQDVEVYNGKPIVYSLGNFIFDQYFSKDTMQGMLFEATFAGKELKNTSQKVITLNKFYQPEGIFEPDPEEAQSQTASACPKPHIPSNGEYVDYSYLNVDQNVSIPDPLYIPFDLVKLDKSISTTTLCLTRETTEALKKMADAAKKERLSILASSAFRSYATQKAILAQNIKEGNPNATIAVAKPGYSEHQLGVAADLTSASIAYASAAHVFGDTLESAWLQEHAHEYGFVLSYPKGKQDITGYMYEPWHYRYVGTDYARAMKESGLTVNQYLKEIDK
ncbi:MAG: CapA family protein [Patescibacteria group bacterium]